MKSFDFSNEGLLEAIAHMTHEHNHQDPSAVYMAATDHHEDTESPRAVFGRIGFHGDPPHLLDPDSTTLPTPPDHSGPARLRHAVLCMASLVLGGGRPFRNHVIALGMVQTGTLVPDPTPAEIRQFEDKSFVLKDVPPDRREMTTFATLATLDGRVFTACVDRGEIHAEIGTEGVSRGILDHLTWALDAMRDLCDARRSIPRAARITHDLDPAMPPPVRGVDNSYRTA